MKTLNFTYVFDRLFVICHTGPLNPCTYLVIALIHLTWKFGVCCWVCLIQSPLPPCLSLAHSQIPGLYSTLEPLSKHREEASNFSLSFSLYLTHTLHSHTLSLFPFAALSFFLFLPNRLHFFWFVAFPLLPHWFSDWLTNWHGSFLPPTSNMSWNFPSYFQPDMVLSFLLLPTCRGTFLPPSNLTWFSPSSYFQHVVELSFLPPTWHGSSLPPSNLTWFFPSSFQPPNSILTPISCSSANWLSNRQSTNMENDWVSFINGINKMCRHFYNGPHPPLLPRIIADILKSVTWHPQVMFWTS